MDNPLVSVLVATYNQAEFLPEALSSLDAQTCDSFEAIVVDDGSTDETARVLEATDYEWLSVLRHDENRGLVPACNRALDVAVGRYCVRLDSDDKVDPNWLSHLLERAERDPEAACVVPDRYVLWPDGERERVEVDPANIYTFVAAGTLFRTEQLREIAGFRQLFWEEYDLYIRLSDCGTFVRLDEPLYIYRKHEQGMTHDRRLRMEGWVELAEEWDPGTLDRVGSHPELDDALKCDGFGD